MLCYHNTERLQYDREVFTADGAVINKCLETFHVVTMVNPAARLIRCRNEILNRRDSYMAQSPCEPAKNSREISTNCICLLGLLSYREGSRRTTWESEHSEEADRSSWQGKRRAR
jgi:hypothetical protein